MRLWLPRTMTGLVAAGSVLVALPLLAAVVLAGLALGRLSLHTQLLIDEGLTVTRLGSDLGDRVSTLERNARQYLALGDPALLEVFSVRERDAAQVLEQLANRAGLEASLAEHLAHVRQGLDEAGHVWSTSRNREALEAAADRIHSLIPEAQAIVIAGHEAVDAQVEQLREAATIARRVILLTTLALVPLAALLLLGFSIVVTRPLKRLRVSIAALGNACYEQPIAIEFPKEIQHLGEQLDWLRRRLAQLEADKDRFLRHVSHELKTPLASLHEGAELLREGSLGALTPRQREVAQIMAESAAELSALIGNLLAYAEWRQEHRQAEMTWFDARPLAEEVLAAQTLSISRRRLSAELELSWPRLFGSRTQLRAALGNLVANAIRHAPAGSAVTVRADVHDGHCELSVRDRGKGVPDDEKEKIFEPFVRGSYDQDSEIRGTGVGLSIVREAALAHDGMVDVEDAAPGAIFRMRWPIPQSGGPQSDAAGHA